MKDSEKLSLLKEYAAELEKDPILCMDHQYVGNSVTVGYLERMLRELCTLVKSDDCKQIQLSIKNLCEHRTGSQLPVEK